MDKQEAIRFLKRSIGEITRLARLHHANVEYPVWHNRVAAVLEEAFGHDSSEYQSFTGAYSTASFGAGTMQALYRKLLRKKYADIRSIILRYELAGVETKPVAEAELPPKAFISHSKESPALDKLEEFLRALGVKPLTVKGQSGVDKTVDDKVNNYLSQADFAVILATGDDEVNGKLHPRKNIIHEIELAQKAHQGRVIYLLEEGTECLSNISPDVWESFTQNDIAKAFLRIVRELKTYGMLKVVKPETEE